MKSKEHDFCHNKNSSKSLLKITSNSIVKLLAESNFSKTSDLIEKIKLLPVDLQRYLFKILYFKYYLLFTKLFCKSFKLRDDFLLGPSVEFSFDSKTLIIRSECGRALKCNLLSKKIEPEIVMGHYFHETVAAIGKNYSLISQDNVVYLWDYFDFKKVKKYKLEGHLDDVQCVVISSNENFALTSSSDCILRLWNLSDLNNIKSKVLKGHKKLVWCASFSNNEKYLLTGSMENHAILWNISDYKNITNTKLKGHKNVIWDVIFHPDNKHGFTVSEDKTVRIWDFSNEDLINSIELKSFKESCFVLNISPNGKYLALSRLYGSVFLLCLDSGIYPTLEQMVLISKMDLCFKKGLSLKNLLKSSYLKEIWDTFSYAQKIYITRYFSYKSSNITI